MGLFDDVLGASQAPAQSRPAVPVVGRALLDTIAGSESPGYNVMYGGGKFEDFADHPRRAVPIASGPNAGKTSSAAGRYQFLGSTWDEVKKEANLPDFSPDSQDQGAWHLAQKTYKTKTGRDLETDLTNAKGNPAAVQGIGKMLSGTWTSLPGGIEPNRATGSFAQRFDGPQAPTEVSAQSRKPVGLFDDFLAPPPPSTGQGAGSVDDAPSRSPTDPAGRFMNDPGVNLRVAREGESPLFATKGQAALGGIDRGVTFNFSDEIKGILAAGGLDPKSSNVLRAANLVMGTLSSPGTALVNPDARTFLTGVYKLLSGDQDAQNTYRVTTSQERETGDRLKEQQPGASIGGEIGGALATAPAGLAARGAGLGARMLAGGATGAASSALSGAGEGTDLESRATGAAKGLAIGGVVGAGANAVIPPVLGAIARPFTGGAAKAVAPTTEEIKAAAVAGFKSPEVAELAVKPVALQSFSTRIGEALNATGVDDILAPKTFGVLAKLGKIPEDAASVTGANLQTLRRTFQNIAGTPDKTERMAASKVIEAIDDFIPNLAAKDIISGNPKAAAEAWALARGNYAAAMRSEDIARAVLKATRQAEAAGSGGNIDNATRQQFKAILNNDKKMRGFNAEEKEAMEAIVSGTTWGNAMRLIGKAAPTGIVSGGLSTGAGFAAGGPVGAVLVPIAGYIGKKLGDRSTAGQVAKLEELVRSRAPVAKSMETFAEKNAALAEGQSPASFSAAMLAARNLSNNLKDAGVNLSPSEIMRSIRGPVPAGAEEDK